MDSKKSAFRSKNKEASVSSVLTVNWFEKYASLYKEEIDEQLYMDILKDLCDDSLNDSIVMHLLSLIEHHFCFDANEDRIEQILGSLMNIYSTTTKNAELKQKYLYTLTSLFICDFETVCKTASINQLFASFIKLLSNIVTNDKSDATLESAAKNCLSQIEDVEPGILSKFCSTDVLMRKIPLLASILFINNIDLQKEDFLEYLPNLIENPLLLHHCLINIYEGLQNKGNQVIFSPLIFKQFIPEFTPTTEMYNFHLLLQILCSYGLEVFSSHEEKNLINQLKSLSTHPSLSIAHRLLALDFLNSLTFLVKASSVLDHKEVEISPFDGPDTQEKKLAILCETDINNDQLMINLKSIENMSIIIGNYRATNALYRTLHRFISVRPSLQYNLELVLISMILAAPQQHIRRCLGLLKVKPQLSQNVCCQVLKKTLKMNDVLKNELDLKEYFIVAEFTFKQKDIVLESEVFVEILKFLHEKCKEFPRLYNNLLKCCAAVIRSRFVTEDIKCVLNDILKFLSREYKHDITILSWSQIYSIALNTLTDQSDLNSIFAPDEDLNKEDDFELVSHITRNIPVIVERTTQNDKKVNLHQSQFYIPLKLKVKIDENSDVKFHDLFAVVISVSCDAQEIFMEQTLPFLKISHKPQTVRFDLACKHVEPFNLNISMHFGDLNGVTYYCTNFKSESFTFRDFLHSVNNNIDYSSLWTSVRNDEGVECVILLKSLHTIDEFYAIHSWLSEFIVKKENDLLFAVSPNKLLFIKVMVINNIINLRVLCNDCQILKYLFYEFKQV